MGDILTLPRTAEAAIVSPELDQATRYAAEVMTFLRDRPTWNWLMRKKGGVYHALVTSPDFNPMGTGYGGAGVAATPAAALKAARAKADEMATNVVRFSVPAGAC